MARLTQAQRVRRQIRTLQYRVVAAQREIARCKKKARSAETHSKFLLGSLVRIADWEDISLAEAEHRVQRIAQILEHTEDVTRFRMHGDALFRIHRRHKKQKEIQSQTQPGSSGVSTPTYKQGDDWTAEKHFRITVGGMVVKYNLAMESKAVLLGAMALVHKRSV